MTLADLGARVIKIERPGTGDDTREWGPPYSETGTTYFDSVNRNKESICLDLKNEADRGIAEQLIARSDVLVENFRSGTMKRLGLDYESVRKDNPGLIYASITGYGSSGGASLPGYDFIAQAVGGLMSITGEPDGPRLKAGVALVDVLTAKDTTVAILAALHERDRTGRGRRVESALMTSVLGALVNQAQAYLGAGEVPSRMGNEHPSIVPYQLLECADRPLAVACGNDGQFQRLCTALGIPELGTDARFRSNRQRVRNRRELIPLLERALSQRTAEHWSAELTKAEVPCGPVLNIDESIEFADQLGLAPTVTLEGPDGSERGRQIRNPVVWEPPFVAPNSPPPLLGEHTDEVLRWLGPGNDRV